MNVLATPRARSNRDDFRPTGGAPATLQYSRDLGGSDSRCDSRDGIINPSNCHSKVTPQGKCVFLLDSALLLSPLPCSPRASFSPRSFFSALELKLELFFSIAPLLALLFGRGNVSRAVRNGRIDDDCRGPKINHVFFRVQRGGGRTGGGGELGAGTVPEKEGNGRLAATRYTHSVDRCRIVYLISGIINQKVQPTLRRNARDRRRSSFTK